jgi:hypothetical protein
MELPLAVIMAEAQRCVLSRFWQLRSCCWAAADVASITRAFFTAVTPPRQARGEGGELGARAMQIGLAIMPGKVDESKSADWNAGFRDGFNKELSGE